MWLITRNCSLFNFAKRTVNNDKVMLPLYTMIFLFILVFWVNIVSLCWAFHDGLCGESGSMWWAMTLWLLFECEGGKGNDVCSLSLSLFISFFFLSLSLSLSTVTYLCQPSTSLGMQGWKWIAFRQSHTSWSWREKKKKANLVVARNDQVIKVGGEVRSGSLTCPTSLTCQV